MIGNDLKMSRSDIFLLLFWKLIKIYSTSGTITRSLFYETPLEYCSTFYVPLLQCTARNVKKSALRF